MKYSSSNPPLVCMQTQSTCYKGTRKMEVKGVLWHSTGANNPWLKRYVQPSDNAPDKAQMLALLGTNTYKNDWNHIEREAGLNCWIGKLASGEVATVQTMPWDYRPWGCGSGSKGSCNSGWIQFEICEDALTDAAYFQKVYKEACEITAYLCQLYKIDPKGTVTVNGVKIPTILDHITSHNLGFGSGHGDVGHWFPKFGKSMETARNDVAALLAGASTAAPAANTTQQEAKEMSQDKFNEMFAAAMTAHRNTLRDNDASGYSEAARAWAVEKGLIAGGQASGQQFNGMWEDYLTREQLVTVLYRFAQMMGQV